METYVLTDLRGMALAFLTGILLGTIYVITALFRHWLKAGTVITAISDVIFGILAAIVIFAFTFLFNNGILRAYIIGSVLVGIALPLFIYRKVRSPKKGTEGLTTERKDWRRASQKRSQHAKRKRT